MKFLHIVLTIEEGIYTHIASIFNVCQPREFVQLSMFGSLVLENKLREVEWLLVQGHDVNEKMSDGINALSIAVEVGLKEMSELLIRYGVNVNNSDADGGTPLHAACFYRHKDLVALLLKHGAKLHAKDSVLGTPMLAACFTMDWMLANDSSEIVRMLLDRGADVNDTDAYGRNALTWAVQDNNLSLVKVLIAANVDVNIFVDFFIKPSQKKGMLPLLSVTLCNKQVDIAKCMLAADTLNVEVLKYIDGSPPLHIACMYGQLDIVKLMVEKKFDVNKMTTENETPLMLAIMEQQFAVAEYLLEQKDINVNLPLYRHPLITAIEICQLLPPLQRTPMQKIIKTLIEKSKAADHQVLVSDIVKDSKSKGSKQKGTNVFKNGRETNASGSLGRGAPDQEFSGKTKTDSSGAFDCKPSGKNKTDSSIADKRSSGKKKTGSSMADKDSSGKNKTDSLVAGKGSSGKNKTGSSIADKDSSGKNKTGSSMADKDSSGKNKTDSLVAGKGSSGKHKTDSSIADKDSSGKDKTGSSIADKDSSGKNKTGSSIADKDSSGKNKTGSSIADKDSSGKDKTGSSMADKDSSGKYKTDSSIADKDSSGKDKTGYSMADKDSSGKYKTDSSIADKDSSGKDKTGYSMADKDSSGKNKTDSLVAGKGSPGSSNNSLDSCSQLKSKDYPKNGAEKTSSKKAKAEREIITLTKAIELGDLSLVKKALGHGAELNNDVVFQNQQIAKVISDETVLAEREKINDFLRVCLKLMRSVRANNVEEVKENLQRGACVNVSHGRLASPLIYASWKGFEDIVDVLLAKGADVNLRAANGIAALHLAARFNKNENIVCKLLKHGAYYNTPHGANKTTPLQYAQMGRNVRAVEIFHAIDQVFEDVGKRYTDDYVAKFYDSFQMVANDEMTKEVLREVKNKEGQTLHDVAREHPCGDLSRNSILDIMLNIPDLPQIIEDISSTVVISES